MPAYRKDGLDLASLAERRRRPGLTTGKGRVTCLPDRCRGVGLASLYHAGGLDLAPQLAPVG